MKVITGIIMKTARWSFGKKMRVILNGEHAMNCNLAVAGIESYAFVNCLRHELCLAAHWLQFNSWRRRGADEKSWRSQFKMRQHQFINKTNRARIEGCLLLLLLFLLYKGLDLSHNSHLTAVFKFTAKNFTHYLGDFLLLIKSI